MKAFTVRFVTYILHSFFAQILSELTYVGFPWTSGEIESC
jgi:hypothetical protein